MDTGKLRKISHFYLKFYTCLPSSSSSSHNYHSNIAKIESGIRICFRIFLSKKNLSNCFTVFFFDPYCWIEKQKNKNWIFQNLLKKFNSNDVLMIMIFLEMVTFQFHLVSCLACFFSFFDSLDFDVLLNSSKFVCDRKWKCFCFFFFFSFRFSSKPELNNIQVEVKPTHRENHCEKKQEFFQFEKNENSFSRIVSGNWLKKKDSKRNVYPKPNSNIEFNVFVFCSA